MFIVVRKAHCNPKCEEDVYIQLPEECKCPEGMCGKLVYWLYGFRPAAAAWERLYSGKLVEVGFERGDSCGVVFTIRREICLWWFMVTISHFVVWMRI